MSPKTEGFPFKTSAVPTTIVFVSVPTPSNSVPVLPEKGSTVSGDGAAGATSSRAANIGAGATGRKSPAAPFLFFFSQPLDSTASSVPRRRTRPALRMQKTLRGHRSAASETDDDRDTTSPSSDYYAAPKSIEVVESLGLPPPADTASQTTLIQSSTLTRSKDPPDFIFDVGKVKYFQPKDAGIVFRKPPPLAVATAKRDDSATHVDIFTHGKDRHEFSFKPQLKDYVSETSKETAPTFPSAKTSLNSVKGDEDKSTSLTSTASLFRQDIQISDFGNYCLERTKELDPIFVFKSSAAEVQKENTSITTASNKPLNNKTIHSLNCKNSAAGHKEKSSLPISTAPLSGLDEPSVMKPPQLFPSTLVPSSATIPTNLVTGFSFNPVPGSTRPNFKFTEKPPKLKFFRAGALTPVVSLTVPYDTPGDKSQRRQAKRNWPRYNRSILVPSRNSVQNQPAAVPAAETSLLAKPNATYQQPNTPPNPKHVSGDIPIFRTTVKTNLTALFPKVNPVHRVCTVPSNKPYRFAKRYLIPGKVPDSSLNLPTTTFSSKPNVFGINTIGDYPVPMPAALRTYSSLHPFSLPNQKPSTSSIPPSAPDSTLASSNTVPAKPYISDATRSENVGVTASCKPATELREESSSGVDNTDASLNVASLCRPMASLSISQVSESNACISVNTNNLEIQIRNNSVKIIINPLRES